MVHRFVLRCATTLLLLAFSQAVRAQFDLQLTISPGTLNSSQLAVLQESVATAEEMWESVILGYQPGISLTTLPINIEATTAAGGLADAAVLGTTTQGGYRLSTVGRVRVLPDTINLFGSWNGTPGPTNPNPDYLGLNYVDDLIAHEIGHILGLGTQWVANDVYITNTGEYTGAHGLAAYREEFDPNADFVPVETAGSAGTQNSHWDQIMRSSSQEGNPSDPWSLDPRVGITDALGRDWGLELMTGALDPDYGEPFLSRTTIQSLRDVGFRVVPEPATIWLLFAAAPRRRTRSLVD